MHNCAYAWKLQGENKNQRRCDSIFWAASGRYRDDHFVFMRLASKKIVEMFHLNSVRIHTVTHTHTHTHTQTHKQTHTHTHTHTHRHTHTHTHQPTPRPTSLGFPTFEKSPPCTSTSPGGMSLSLSVRLCVSLMHTSLRVFGGCSPCGRVTTENGCVFDRIRHASVGSSLGGQAGASDAISQKKFTQIKLTKRRRRR